MNREKGIDEVLAEVRERHIALRNQFAMAALTGLLAKGNDETTFESVREAFSVAEYAMAFIVSQEAKQRIADREKLHEAQGAGAQG